MFRTVPLSIIRRFSLYTQQWHTSYRFADSLRAGSGRNCSSVLILLLANLYDIYHCCVYSQKLLMIVRKTVRNMYSFILKINLRNWCIQLVYYKNLSRCTVTCTSNTTEMLKPFLRTEILTLARSHDEQALPKKERIVTSLYSFIIGGTDLLILTAQ